MASSTHSDQTLPSARHLITSLIISLTKARNAQGSETAELVSSDNKPALLTLHTLFPNELLPALDLLDRGLVTRLRIADNITEEHSRSEPPAGDPIHPTDVPERKPLTLYTVRSAQPPPRSKHAVAATPTSYIVNLRAWSCSCPAFAFAAFPAEPVAVEAETTLADESEAWRLGGLSSGDDVAVCKHLLACVLADQGDGSEPMVEERVVSVEELAGWAAGWGD